MQWSALLAGLGLVLSLTPAQAMISCQPVKPGEKFVSPIVNPGKISPIDGTCWVNKLTLTAFDDAKLTANVFLPRITRVDQRFPAIIMVNSWALADFEYLGQAARLARDGYVVYSYSTRGFWQSEGQVEVAGPQDIRDVSSALDWLQAHAPVDMKNVGISGISYGSGISLIALAQEPRLKTAAALSTWGNLEDELYGADTANQTWSDLLVNSGKLFGRLNPIVPAYAAALKEPRTPKSKIDEIRVWARIRSPLQYVPMLNARQAPVFISKNFQDDLFTPNSSLEMFRRLTGPKKLLVNQGIHAVTEVPGALLGADNYIYDQAHRWFDYWLKGEPNGIVDEPKVTMEVKFSRARDSFDDYPASNVLDHTYYLHPRGAVRWDLSCWCWKGGVGELASTANQQTADDWIDNAADTTATSGPIPIFSTLAESANIPIVNWLPSVHRGQGVRYEGPWLRDALRLRGIPKLTLKLKPSQPQAQLVAYLYDVDGLGFGKLITHGVRTVVDARPGAVLDFPIEFSATAYDVPAGHRVAVVLDTRDSLYAHPSDGYLDKRLVFNGHTQSTLILPSIR
ncbi:putative acyl esterase [Chitinivorax tropicus]|uniref:Putative acyl esterase n=1 Tax=Chitinivorax tropicus TaxID=714531 RepID=A0A840MR40_9PROT|nr:CocE/NonD family hydrolase [Chitinivorax tropicus]MBB5019549.1 putative acyl esterase [Chitinivorax tropicus]